MADEAVRVRMFDEVYLSSDTAAGLVERVNSHAVVPEFETVAVHGTVYYAARGGGYTLALALEGSYDGQTWLTTGLSAAAVAITDTDLEAKASSSTVASDYAFMRLRATVTIPETENAAVRFSADLVFTHQVN